MTEERQSAWKGKRTWIGKNGDAITAADTMTAASSNSKYLYGT